MTCHDAKMKNTKIYKFIENIDQALQIKYKQYFLLKKLEDYEKRLNHRNKCSLNCIKHFERTWEKINRKYTQVNIYGIEFVGIGETIPRLFMFLSDQKQRNRDVLHIVLPTFYPYYKAGIVNAGIFAVFHRQIRFITEKTINFWKYVAVLHSDKINIEYFDKYKYRGNPKRFDIEVGKALISFSNEIEMYAKKKMLDMGIHSTYVCIHAREVATKLNNFVATYADTSVLDCDINSFKEACSYMTEAGYQVVRMGKDESKKCELRDVIDYANNFYDEIMDFYLVANCKFLIGSSGLIAIAAFWGRPVLQVNTVGFSHGMESLPWTEFDMYLPKKFYSRKKRRFLNLIEMMDISYKCDRYKNRYMEEGIELIDNTEEEILNATMEMNEKLNHTWIQTEDEINCMEKHKKILETWKDKHKVAYENKENGGKGLVMFARSICYSYLKENMYLLDVGEFI